KEVRQMSTSTGAHAIAFSPDGKTLAAWHVGVGAGRYLGKCALLLWEVATGKERARLMEVDRLESTRLAFSADGKLLASSAPGSTIYVWEVATAKKLHCLEGHRGPVTSLFFSADSKLLASGSDDTSVLIWDLAHMDNLPR